MGRTSSCLVLYSHCEAAGHAFLSCYISGDRVHECAVRLKVIPLLVALAFVKTNSRPAAKTGHPLT